MAAKVWQRSSVRWDYRITEDRPDELPAVAPRIAVDAPVTAEVAELREQEELKDATSLPIYGRFDAPALRKEVLEPDAFKVRRRAGSR
jgi:hypothetical protein